jgi:hypothetical protein
MGSLRLTLLPVIATALALAVGTGAWVRRRRKPPEELERMRRLAISQIGRITDGTVIDAQEIQHGDGAFTQLVIYQYDVGGVEYEASQDITHLRQFVDLHTCRIGVPASIKYDPQNPGNSIVISEAWSGLRL